MFLFCIGMFHFGWYCLMIVFELMWDFGFSELAGEKFLKQNKRVKKECKKFTACDTFHEMAFEGITCILPVCALPAPPSLDHKLFGSSVRTPSLFGS